MLNVVLMELVLDRFAKKERYTIGNLYIDGKLECNTLEDTDRGLSQSMSENDILRVKEKFLGETAIPTGRYEIIFVNSPRFGKTEYAINGKVPLLRNVKGFKNIEIHAGSYPKDTRGCILPGENRMKGMVVNSRKTCKRINEKLWFVISNGGRAFITVK